MLRLTKIQLKKIVDISKIVDKFFTFDERSTEYTGIPFLVVCCSIFLSKIVFISTGFRFSKGPRAPN